MNISITRLQQSANKGQQSADNVADGPRYNLKEAVKDILDALHLVLWIINKRKENDTVCLF